MSIVRSKLAQNFSWLLLGEITARGLAIANLAYLARVLGTAGFGDISLATVLVGYGLIIADFGLPIVGLRAISRDRGSLPQTLSLVLATRLGLSAVVILFVTAWCVLFAPSQLATLIAISFLWLVPYALSIDWAFRAIERMELSSVWNLAQQILVTIVCWLLVKGPADILLVPVIRTIACAVAAAILFTPLWSIRTQILSTEISVANMIGMLKRSGYIAISALMVQVYLSFDTIVLAAYHPSEEVGIYSAAYRVVTIFLILGYVATNSFSSRLSQAYSTDFNSYRHSSKSLLFLCTIGGTLGAAFIAVLSPIIIVTIFGHQYESASGILRILGLVVLFEMMNAAMGCILVSSDNEKLVMLVTTSGAILNLALNFALIPSMASVGAALATVLTYVASSILFVGVLLNRVYYRVEKPR